LHTRLSGASGARHSLRPLFEEGGKDMHNPGAMRRGNAKLCLHSSLRGALLSAEARLRAKADATKQSIFLYAAPWIASWSLSSGARSRDPLARNDGIETLCLGCLKIESAAIPFTSFRP
jgi:hypothetical protein